MSSEEDSPSREERIDALIVEFLDAVEAGHPPDREAFLAAHPDLADELREFFEGQAQFRALATATPRASPDSAAPGSATPEAAAGERRGSDEPTVSQPSETPVDLAPSLLSFGDYELINEIARGGMGLVYKARQTSLNRLVAVKVILSGQLA